MRTMRPVVVDSSVVLAWLLADEPAHRPAGAIRAEIEDGSLEPIVAGHFGFELRSGLMQAARRHRIGWDSVASQAMTIEVMQLTVHPLSNADESLLGLCRDHGLSWADAHWVHLAASIDAPLITADRELARRVPDVVAVMVDILTDAP